MTAIRDLRVSSLVEPYTRGIKLMGVLEIELQSAERMYQVKVANLNQVRLHVSALFYWHANVSPNLPNCLIAPHGTGKDFFRDANCRH